MISWPWTSRPHSYFWFRAEVSFLNHWNGLALLFPLPINETNFLLFLCLDAAIVIILKGWSALVWLEYLNIDNRFLLLAFQRERFTYVELFFLESFLQSYRGLGWYFSWFYLRQGYRLYLKYLLKLYCWPFHDVLQWKRWFCWLAWIGTLKVNEVVKICIFDRCIKKVSFLSEWMFLLALIQIVRNFHMAVV